MLGAENISGEGKDPSLGLAVEGSGSGRNVLAIFLSIRKRALAPTVSMEPTRRTQLRFIPSDIADNPTTRKLAYNEKVLKSPAL